MSPSPPVPAQLRRWVLIAGLLLGLFTLHVLANHHNGLPAPAVIASSTAPSPAASTPQPGQPAGDQHLLDDCILFLAAVSSMMALGFTTAGRPASRSTSLSWLIGRSSSSAAAIGLPRFLLSVQRT